MCVFINKNTHIPTYIFVQYMYIYYTYLYNICTLYNKHIHAIHVNVIILYVYVYFLFVCTYICGHIYPTWFFFYVIFQSLSFYPFLSPDTLFSSPRSAVTFAWKINISACQLPLMWFLLPFLGFCLFIYLFSPSLP